MLGRSILLFILSSPVWSSAQLGPEHRFIHGTNYGTDHIVADIDDDGDNDLVQATSTRILIHEQVSTGTYRVTQDLGPSHTAFFFDHVDLNGDAVKDLVMVQQANGQIVWAEGLGSGVFAPTMPLLSSITNAYELHVADLNNDASMDLLFTIDDPNGDDSLYWSAGTGAGTFSQAEAIAQVPAGYIGPNALRDDHFGVADLDQDGDQDICADLPNGVTVLFNDGIGGFSSTGVPMSGLNTFKQLHDLDGDGDTDILGQSGTSATTCGIVGWCKNFGGGTFATAQTVGQLCVSTLGTFVVSVQVADRDGDMDMDVFVHGVGDNSAPDQVAWFINDGQGSFIKQDFWITDSGLRQGLGDLNDDALPDVVGYTGSALRVAFSDGTVTRFGSVTTPDHLAAADLNGDNYPEVVVTTADVNSPHDDGEPPLFVAVHTNNATDVDEQATELFLSPTHPDPNTSPVDGSVLVDLQQDGDLDVLFRQGAASYLLMANRNLGTGAWDPVDTLDGHISVLTSNRPLPELGDIDMDGQIEFCYSEAFGIRCNGNSVLYDPLHNLGEICMIDVDVDGDPDFLAHEPSNFGSDSLIWYENDGAGSFGPSQELMPNPTLWPNGLVVSDLDLDGDDDLVIEYDNGDLLVYANLGLLNFILAQQLSTGTTNRHWVDLNSDGYEDVLGATGGTILVWLNNGGTLSTQPVWLGQYAQNIRAITTADMDLDGNIDVLVAGTRIASWFSVQQLDVSLGDGPVQETTLMAIPNPFTARTRLLFSKVLSPDHNIEMVDVNGHVLRTMQGNGTNEVLLEREGLSEGLYVVRISEAGKHLGATRVVVQ